MWAEVFSRSDQRWIPVDPMRGTIRKKTHYEPGSDNGPVRMAYVMAFEEGEWGCGGVQRRIIARLMRRWTRARGDAKVYEVVWRQDVETAGADQKG
jgi:xeroderma pigmentosum group C-complementing protein